MGLVFADPERRRRGASVGGLLLTVAMMALGALVGLAFALM